MKNIITLNLVQKSAIIKGLAEAAAVYKKLEKISQRSSAINLVTTNIWRTGSQDTIHFENDFEDREITKEFQKVASEAVAGIFLRESARLTDFAEKLMQSKGNDLNLDELTVDTLSIISDALGNRGYGGENNRSMLIKHIKSALQERPDY